LWRSFMVLDAYPGYDVRLSSACIGLWQMARPRGVRRRMQIIPKGERVLVKVGQQEEKTRGGILLPISAQKRPTSGGPCSVGGVYVCVECHFGDCENVERVEKTGQGRARLVTALARCHWHPLQKKARQPCKALLSGSQP
jgi:hypothetical protein